MIILGDGQSTAVAPWQDRGRPTVAKYDLWQISDRTWRRLCNGSSAVPRPSMSKEGQFVWRGFNLNS